MKVGISRWRLSVLTTLALGVLGVASQAQPRQEIPLNDAQLQTMMNPTLQSLQITAASTGGSMTMRLPNGRTLSRMMNLGEITVPSPNPFPGVVCTVNPIRNDGAPVVHYVNGRVQLTMLLRPVNSGNVIDTRWTRDSFWLPDAPGISVSRIDVTGSFNFAQSPTNLQLVVANDLQVQVRGDWRAAGLLSGASAAIQGRINTAVAANIRNMLINDLNMMVGLSTAQYLSTQARLTPVQLQSVRNEAARAVFVVRAPDPVLIGVTPNAPILDSAVLARVQGTPRQNATIDDWIGMWGDGTTSENSRTIVMVSQVDDGLYLYAREVAANGAGIYRNQFENQRPRGSLLQPETLLRLQLVSLADGSPRIRYTREAYENFVAGNALLRRLRVPASDNNLPRPDDEKLEPTDPVYEPAPDPKIAAVEEEDRKRKAEADALKNKQPDKQPQKQPDVPDAIDAKEKENTTQISSAEGNIGDWLSNGIWKLRVTKVEKIESQFDPGRIGWGVTIEFTNVNSKKKTLQLFNTGAAGKPILADAGGEPMSIDEGDWQTGAYFKDVLPAQTRKWQIKYFYAHNEKPSEGPERLVLEFDPKSGLLRDMGVKFNVADPSFRVFLK